VDVRQNHHAIIPEILQWHDENIVPRYSRAGVKKMAFLAPEVSMNRASSEAVFEEENAKAALQVQFFDDEDELRAWLGR
jgi:hypothetical protein